ncbi:MAG: ribosome maturation factor RimP [Desulfobacteraceae bacterium]|nr:ribosome maturation factor RimP [Desulfobacteraceae bacterium]
MMELQDNPGIPAVVGSATNPIVGRVWQLAEPLCLGEGMELVHVEYQREPAGRTLRIYMDKPGGVTLDDCVNISRQLGDILDVGLDTELSYRMEVSSPGAQRPLGRLSDFERFRGRRIKVRTVQPIQGRKNFTGTLEGVQNLSVRLVVSDQTMDIAFTDIVKAHLIN